ncbi:histidinol dehydrogenase [Pannus brasiliensis CCIBt3594]|uniref:Histidinol dehydrogenase n=1 Tax=Pannus brasiliensis CCIBt3594 TaxID=1427578 RepID=A0AAW9QNS6_9CHRO
MLRIISEPWSARTELRRIRERFDDPDIRQKESLVREIVDEVRLRKDDSLIEYTEKFYHQVLDPHQIKVSGSELDAAYQQVSQELLGAIERACQKLEAFHRQRLPKPWVQFNDDGTVFARRYQPIASLGIHVPDGNRAYLSLLLQQAIPARVAGVKRVILVSSPGAELRIHPAILVAAQEAGISEIYRVGGPQAIAALTYGTETIEPVDTIAGIGDFYVTLAKKLVADRVRVDSLYNASDLVIIADKRANPRRLAMDLLAQAEQYSLASAILFTTDKTLAAEVQERVHQQLQVHPQRLLTEKAIAHYGLIVVVDSIARAVELSNSFAPSHLELIVEEPWDLLPSIRQTGTIFLGASTPKAIGDYLGCNATSVENFLQSSIVIEYPADPFQKMSDTLETLARSEGFISAVESIQSRVEGDGE